MAKYKAKVNTKEVESKKTKKINKQVKKALKDTKMLSDEQIQIRNFVILLISLIAVIIGLYFLSDSIINKRENADNTNTNTEVVISYDSINVGTILNRPYDEYYVLVFDASKPEAAKYEAVLSNYKSSENGIKIYSVDLSKKINASHVSKTGEGNANVYDNVADFEFGESTLLYINGGVVAGYYESFETIRDILSED